MKWRRTTKNVSPLCRDFRELLANDFRRLYHRDALFHRLLDSARLEPAIGMRPELLRGHIAQALADPLRGHLDCLGVVRVHVDDPDRKLLRERIAVEQLEPAIAV